MTRKIVKRSTFFSANYIQFYSSKNFCQIFNHILYFGIICAKLTLRGPVVMGSNPNCCLNFFLWVFFIRPKIELYHNAFCQVFSPIGLQIIFVAFLASQKSKTTIKKCLCLSVTLLVPSIFRCLNIVGFPPKLDRIPLRVFIFFPGFWNFFTFYIYIYLYRKIENAPIRLKLGI